MEADEHNPPVAVRLSAEHADVLQRLLDGVGVPAWERALVREEIAAQLESRERLWAERAAGTWHPGDES